MLLSAPFQLPWEPMIHYHGSPITPETDAARILVGRHAMVSFGAPQQIELVADACQSFSIDNGAFPAWKSGTPVLDWSKYFDFVAWWGPHPGFDFALIPDVIDGSEQDNNALLYDLPDHMKKFGVPVWHLHESLERLAWLADNWPRVALGSSGDFSSIGTRRWWNRMAEAMGVCCLSDGRPVTKLHGLRMLDPNVFTKFPFASADSTNVARNVGLDSRWNGSYTPANKAGRGVVLAERIEAFNSPRYWVGLETQPGLFMEASA